MRRLLNEHPEITAVTTINEAALPGIQHTLETAGLKIPRDFSIAGVAAKTWAEDFRPPLTTADVPAHEIGAQAVQLLIERIANPQTPHRHILMRPPISLRSSTGPVRNHRATTLPSRPSPGTARNGVHQGIPAATAENPTHLLLTGKLNGQVGMAR